MYGEPDAPPPPPPPIDSTNNGQMEQQHDHDADAGIAHGTPSSEIPPGLIIMTNISFATTESQITELLSSFGPVSNIQILKRPDGKSKGVVTAEFETLEIAQTAKDQLDKTEYEGRVINFRLGTDPRPPKPQRHRRMMTHRSSRPYRDLDKPQENRTRIYDMDPDQVEESKQPPKPQFSHNDSFRSGRYNDGYGRHGYDRGRRYYDHDRSYDRSQQRSYDAPVEREQPHDISQPPSYIVQDFRTQRQGENPPPPPPPPTSQSYGDPYAPPPSESYPQP